MDWEQLLSLKRFGDQYKRLRKEQNELRSGFEVDYDRIVFSQAFRSLQDKTQVIPFSKKDFVHTRLTHSLEVSVVARSLGRLAGAAILDKNPALQKIHGYTPDDFGAITAAAALAHDIGNPPFGHSGEKAIGEFFSRGAGQQYEQALHPSQWQDLCAFEGNANGFKILTESLPGAPGGLRLSYATLGTFIKYPKMSLPKASSTDVAQKKFGIFQSDAPFFQELTQELGLQHPQGCYRHPLAFLVEAADDICYTVIDFEDGINLGWISEDYALEYLLNLVRDRIDQQKYSQLQYKPQRISYLRALAIHSLIEDSVRVFMDHQSEILQGTYPFALTDKSRYQAQIEDIISLSVRRIYKSDEVMEKEIVGYQVISRLLENFVPAAIRAMNATETNYDRLLLRHIPKQFELPKADHYSTLLQVCCFVASLSDGQAKTLSDRLGGIKS
ncbi:MAG: deoxyguanosinetriphosphate triphosphohydrolase [Flavobacteriaceae bacterium]